MSSHIPERRLFTRIIFDANTSITQGDKTWDVDLIDLSLNGLLIKEPNNWQINPNNQLTATITLDSDISIDMTISQKHIEHGNVGFQCDHLDIDSISHLRRLVELNLGDATLLERELEALGR